MATGIERRVVLSQLVAVGKPMTAAELHLGRFAFVGVCDQCGSGR